METIKEIDAKMALAKHLECDPSELSEERHDHYGLTVYSLGSQEYAVGDRKSTRLNSSHT